MKIPANVLEKVIEALDALELLRPYVEGVGWMPIETAPKDGTIIITVVEGYRPTVGWWEYGEWVNDALLSMSQIKDRNTSIIGDNFVNSYEPTHWMKLPQPPQHEGSE